MYLGLISQANPWLAVPLTFLPYPKPFFLLHLALPAILVGHFPCNKIPRAAGGIDLANLQKRRSTHHFFFFQNDTPTSTCFSEIAGERGGCHGNRGGHTNRSSTFLPRGHEQGLLLLLPPPEHLREALFA